MAKRKGLSFEEKRQRMLHVFHSSQDVLNFKEVQKLSIQAGIAFPSVKQVLQSLRADDLVDSDKIGAGNFFWAFPSKGGQVLQEKLIQKQARFVQLGETLSNIQSEISNAETTRKQTSQYKSLMQQYQRLLQSSKELDSELQGFRRRDPKLLQQRLKSLSKLDAKINFWTDNAYQLMKFLKQQNPGLTNDDLLNGYELAQWDYVQ